MDRKTIGIGVLLVTAFVMFLTLVLDRPAQADFSLKDRDYQLAVMKYAGGDDALYVIDNRSGKVIVFTYNPNRRRIEAVGGEDLSRGFK